ncbi:MAG TPA: LptE family protein [Vicinamibacterales bacterium]|nr:LptE family protein [Vicinamibacterales bacterium]
MWSSYRTGLLAGVLVAAVASSGCGYALAGRGNFLPNYIRTIGIPTFQNHTSYFALAELVTDKVRTEFIGRGNYKIVPEATGADAVLVGAVTNVSIVPTSISAEQQASRYTITVTANIELRDVAKDTVLWTNPALSVREEYDATSSISNDPTGIVDPSTFFNQETNAVERVSSEFSRTVVSAILEAF